MKLLLIQLLDFRFPFGGAHKANRALAQAWASRGHEVQVIAPGYESVQPRPDERTRLTDALAASGIAVHACSDDFLVYEEHGVEVHAIVSSFSLARYEEFYDYIEARICAFDPDWIVVSEDHTGLFLGAAIEIAPERVVYLCHSQATLPFGPEAFDRDSARARLFTRVAGILTVSAHVQRYLRDWGGCDAEVLPIPVYGEPPFPWHGDFDRGAVLLINASPLKGLPIFLELASRLPDVHFATVATWDPGDRAALEALPNVQLLQPSEEVDDLLAQTRVLLVPSLWGEAFGQVVVEAMLRGIPVLASDLGGLPEAKLGVDYLLPVTPIAEYRREPGAEKPVPVIPAQDVGPWLETLTRVLRDRDHYRRLSAESRAAALRFVEGIDVGAFDAYFGRLAARRGRGTPAAKTSPGDPAVLAPRTPRSMLLVTTGTHGDVLPFVVLGRGLVSRGHRVTLVTHAPFAEAARAAGLDFVPLDTEEAYDRLIEDTAELFTQTGDVFDATRSYLERQRVFEDDRAIYRLLERAADPHTTLVGRYEDVPSLLLAETHDLPLAWVLLSPSHLATARVRGELFGDMLGDSLNRLRADLGLGPIDGYLDWLSRADRTLALWPEWFADPDEPVEPLGFLLDDESGTEPPPPGVEELFAGEPPVLISSGTTKIIRPDFFTSALASCRRMGLPALAVTRHRELVPEPLPPGARWCPWLPFPAVLGRARALVHHGGIGTIAHALAAGVPQLILPDGVDRPDNARRMKREGLAVWLQPEEWTPDAVAAGLRRALDPAFVERCRGFASRYRSEPPLPKICSTLAGLSKGARTVSDSAGTHDASPAGAPPDDTRRRLDQMSPALRTRLAMKIARERRAGRRSIPARPRTGGGDRFPLSFAQQRFWFLERFDARTYTVAVAPYRLRGAFRTDLLALSLGDLVARHEILRTTFPEVDGEPEQCVSPEGLVKLEIEDLRALPAGAREARVQRAIADEHREGFDLAAGPLMRARLFELADDEHILVLSLHHMVYDGWSVQILIRELMAGYNDYLRHGAPVSLPPLPIQYADFAAWQREHLDGPDVEPLLDFWTERLRGCPPALELRTDRPRPPIQTFAGEHVPVEIPPALARRLRDFASSAGASLFSVLLAAAKVLLYRYTMQPDLVVGVPTAGRNRVETEPVVGPFLNMLAVRTRLEPEASFRALVDRVAATVLASQEHQDMPFDKLVEVVAPERDPSRHPLFQVIFSLNQRSRIEHRFDGVETEYFEAEHKTARVDLAFELWDEPDGRVTGALELNRDLFELETIVRMERHYVHLLESLMAEPGLAVARASLLTAQERERLLPEPTAPTWTLPSDGGVDRVVSRWAARQPEATAVVSPDGALTYAALDRRAARLARRLRDAGVDGSQPVAMILPNGPEHVTAMLGVLKACAPYVCLDPGYPAARIRQILDDVTPAAVIVSTPFSGAPPAWYRSDDGVPVIALAPVDAPALEPEPDESPAGEVRIPEAEMPIYLAYTSGSTGRPKGVVLTHGGFRYVVEWFAERFGLAPGKSVAQWISVVHDPCYVEVFGALVAGATVAVPSPTMRQDPALVAEWIEREGISLIQMVPSFCRQLLELDSVRTRSMRLASLDAVLLVGEELPVQLARTWRRRFGDRPQLWNVYGPTESILVTAQEVDAATARRRTIPVGTPVDGCRLFVLDA
jgi:non-ribosomal peptide synthetase component F/UDP:flavonoid glycosyltransferase YjiC (YdhE family)/glycosyltransferase involved in cell wall biosynthesis